MTIDVLIADDHQSVRQGVRSLLKASGDIEVIGEAEDGQEVVAMARRLEPDVIVMDIVMPGRNGLEVLEALKDEVPETRVVLLSLYVDPNLVREAYKNGAAGYVVKLSPAEELVTAVRAAYAGDRYFSVEYAVRAPEDDVMDII